ncbi:histidine phosphatase family protein [Herbaspirillum sp. alder98]|uniref:histidine phosphatase family protein n=1 Tax=Herbaspirillum sp. alder98 TaxID=2913096 RepID=UPI001CD8BA7D|nr:histidine phosphatase family protein [Herbaspirillum sp. alder98]MCA1322700.1 histidine phosphatase family protein [Herbaspirillum sp. alder98]
MNLHLVRHPAPILDKSYCYGRSDIAVAPQTLALCCERVSQMLPSPLLLWSSPLQRCADLALALAQKLEVAEVTLDADLQEMDFGSWELRAWDDIAWDEVEAWNRDLLHHAPGGGETLLAMAARVWRSFDALRALAADDCAVICHGGSIRLLRACAAWHAEHESDAANTSATPATPDAHALESIALRALADKRDVAFGEVITLALGPRVSVLMR